MLPQAFLDRLNQLASDYGVRLALLFGSAASGRTHERSDVDVALLFRETPDFDRFAKFQHELQMELPGRKLDLVLLEHADPLLLKKITESCGLIYGDVRELERLKTYAFRRYQDHRRFLELEREYVHRFIEEVNAGR